jgi:molecular chaperone DnaJ
VTCETCSGSGKAGTKPKTSTATASRIRHTQGGFFTLERTCPICQAAAR